MRVEKGRSTSVALLSGTKCCSSKVVFQTFMQIGLVLLLVLTANGCSTIKVHTNKPGTIHPYVGTKVATKQFFNSFIHFEYYGVQGLYAMDIPLCLFADTLLLPYDLHISLGRVSRRNI